MLGTLVLVFAFGRYLVPVALEHLSRQRNREGFLLWPCSSQALATHEVGLSMAVGGFLMGMLLSESRCVYQEKAHIEPYKECTGQ